MKLIAPLRRESTSNLFAPHTNTNAFVILFERKKPSKLSEFTSQLFVRLEIIKHRSLECE